VTTNDIVWLDFNDAAEPRNELVNDTETLRTGLLDRLEAVLHYLFPQGRMRGGKFYVGDTDGSPGKSLVVELDGARRGLWKDFATDDGGDVIDLWARSQGLSTRQDFPRLATEIRQWLGVAPPAQSIAPHAVRTVAVDELGPYTAKWDYLTPEGELIGLFLERPIEGGLTPKETASAIRAQGGLVYLEHPYDPFRRHLSEKAIESLADLIDIVEVFNGRSDEQANRRAADLRDILDAAPGAGSDAHTLREIGSGYVEMEDFEGAQDFLNKLRRGTIARRRNRLLLLAEATWGNKMRPR